MVFDRALCDLGTNFSLMPISMCKKLGIGEMEPINVSLQLADKPVKYPIGVLEDVPIKIWHIYILIDFIITDIEEDLQVPIIVGRPFFHIFGAIIGVKKRKLSLEVGNERIEFIMTSFLKDPYTKVSCYLVDEVKTCDEVKPEHPTLKVEQKTLPPIKKYEPTHRRRKNYNETQPENQTLEVE